MNTQLTLRGLDPETKAALIKKAKQEDMSLNRYAIKTLSKSLGDTDSAVRYANIKRFFNTHAISIDDTKTLDDALSWSRDSSIKKQLREQL